MQVDAYKCDRCGDDMTRDRKVTLNCLTHQFRVEEPRSQVDLCMRCADLLYLWLRAERDVVAAAMLEAGPR